MIRKGLISNLLLVLCLSCVPAFGAEFDDFFEQAAFIPTDYHNRIYVSGEFMHVNGPVANEEGTFYVNSELLGKLLNMGVVSNNPQSGELGYMQLEKGQHSYGYPENGLLDLIFKAGETTTQYQQVTKNLQHAPYSLMTPEGATYIMSPLRDICLAMGKHVDYREGVIIISDQPTVENNATNTTALQQLTSNLTKPYAEWGGVSLVNKAGRIFVDNVYKKTPTGTVELSAENNWDSRIVAGSTGENVTDLQQVNMTTGETKTICTLPAVSGGSTAEGPIYESVRDAIYLPTPQGEFVLASCGRTVMSSYKILYKLDAKHQPVELINSTINDYTITDQGIFYSEYMTVGGVTHDLLRYSFTDGSSTVIGDDEMSFYKRQLLDNQQMLVLVKTAWDTNGQQQPQYLYQLDLATLVLTPIGQVPISDFTYKDGAIIYQNSSDQKLYQMTAEGESIRAISEQAVRDFQLEGGNIYYTDHVGYLYCTELVSGDSKQLSDKRAKNYKVYQGAVYLATRGYNAGLYRIENGQDKLIYSGEIGEFDIDVNGDVVITSVENVGKYFTYSQGKLETWPVQ